MTNKIMISVVNLTTGLFDYTKPMVNTTIISIADLAAHLKDPGWMIVDARFSLADPSLGRRNYLAGHILGAIYAHLDHDLSSKVIPGVTGRHPLPDAERTAQVFTRWGIPEKGQVVVYDALWGALAAVRVWWMLRWLGYENVAVLDGGWQQWQKHKLPIQAGEQIRTARSFLPAPRPEMQLSTDQVAQIRWDPAWRLLDARGADRFHGENETIDPVAGHIPGAITLYGEFEPRWDFPSSSGTAPSL
jgi:thiosulfate/3-mercaptopyruvate sulfurtransferase